MNNIGKGKMFPKILLAVTSIVIIFIIFMLAQAILFGVTSVHEKNIEPTTILISPNDCSSTSDD